MLPWLDIERHASHAHAGLRRFGFDRIDAERNVRGLIEGQMMAIANHAAAVSRRDREVIATGGAAVNRAILQVMANVFGVDVYRLDVENSAALGAACARITPIGLAAGEPVSWKTVVSGFTEPQPEHRVARIQSTSPCTRSYDATTRCSRRCTRIDGRFVERRGASFDAPSGGTKVPPLPVDAEGEDRLRRVVLSRLDQRGREVRLVRRIRVMLRLETKAAATRVRASLSGQLPIEKIAGVKLHARFRGRDLEGPAVFGSTTRAARRRLPACRSAPSCDRSRAVLHLRIRLIDPRADRGRRAKVERRAFNGRESPVGIKPASTGV
jgi:hypothetical protein